MIKISPRVLIALSLSMVLMATSSLAIKPKLPTDKEDTQAWVVNDYRYVQGTSKDDPVMGLSLCSTRCNAKTTDYRNVIDPGGWEYIKVAENKELTVELNNPFIGGHCVCIADEYIIKYSDFNLPMNDK